MFIYLDGEFAFKTKTYDLSEDEHNIYSNYNSGQRGGRASAHEGEENQ